MATDLSSSAAQTGGKEGGNVVSVNSVYLHPPEFPEEEQGTRELCDLQGRDLGGGRGGQGADGCTGERGAEFGRRRVKKGSD